MAAEPDDLWVFAYGSLMWQQGFPHVEAVAAHLDGYTRAFCIYSQHYRGTFERPGLVLGLSRGGHCQGMAFRVAAALAEDTRRYLRRRELIYGVYREVQVPVTLAGPSGRQDRRIVTAVTYIADTAHPSFAAGLGVIQQTAIIKGAAGIAGTNLDYLANTVGQLRNLNIRQAGLERLLDFSGGRLLAGDAVATTRPRALALYRAWSRKPQQARIMSRSRVRAFSFRANLND
jgi:glutathione-specific gamma-glutamylcyclotransferase